MSRSNPVLGGRLYSRILSSRVSDFRQLKTRDDAEKRLLIPAWAKIDNLRIRLFSSVSSHEEAVVAEKPESDVTFTFELLEEVASAEEINEATYALRLELIEAGCSNVGRPSETSPDGSKSHEALAVGSLIVTLAPVILPKVVDLLKVWITHREGRRITLKTSTGDLEVTGAISHKDLMPLLKNMLEGRSPAAKSKP
jgi:hypothetical protein